MAEYLNRHDKSGTLFKILRQLLVGRKGTFGGYINKNRQLINGVFWGMRTGAPFIDSPSDNGDGNAH